MWPRHLLFVFFVLFWERDAVILHPNPNYNWTGKVLASAASTASSDQNDIGLQLKATESLFVEEFDPLLKCVDDDVEQENGRKMKRILVMGVDGGTESIRVSCFDAKTGEVVGSATAIPYPTTYPYPGWAEQNPRDWYEGLCQAVRQTMRTVQQALDNDYEMAAVCLDTTCCSVVALDETFQPLRPCLLWMDQRSVAQTRQVATFGKGDPALLVNGNKNSPSISAEWLIPKALWLRQNEYESTWLKSHVICEYQDYLNHRLTGVMTASACNAATRWNWDVQRGCTNDYNKGSYTPDLPTSLLRVLGMPDLTQKLPETCLAMGELVGTLTERASKDLGLPLDTKVIQGGPDAFVGMIGLGCVGGDAVFKKRQSKDGTKSPSLGLTSDTINKENKPRLCLITGSSHLHCLVVPALSEEDKDRRGSFSGMWGPYQDSPLPGLAFCEGGQSSTGSLLRWARTKLFDDSMSYSELDLLASQVPPGSDGLVALATFQGSRTPVTDPLARGAFIGLTLSHTKAHVWRALMEGVCFGTRSCIEALELATNVTCEEIVLAGGIARSNFWLQMHADITNKTIRVFGSDHNAPLLGCAILASVGIGVYDSVEEAAQAMLPPSQLIVPHASAVAQYQKIYTQVYSHVFEGLRPLVHSIHHVLQQIKSASEDGREREGDEDGHYILDASPILDESNNRTLKEVEENNCGTASALEEVKISPSLLACDFGSVAQEVERCLNAGATRLHVDVFDGVALNSPTAFTFGPDMVRAIASAIQSRASGGDATKKDIPAVIDLHMCVSRPERFVEAMAQAGGSCFIFQWEGLSKLGRLHKAIFLAKTILQHKMQCGVSVNPRTPVEEIFPILEMGLISVVDVLAVEPGFGGQSFQNHVLRKVSTLSKWKAQKGLSFYIMVDGGVNKDTAKMIKSAGANILVSGSFLFNHSQGIRAGMDELLN